MTDLKDKLMTVTNKWWNAPASRKPQSKKALAKLFAKCESTIHDETDVLERIPIVTDLKTRLDAIMQDILLGNVTFLDAERLMDKAFAEAKAAEEAKLPRRRGLHKPPKIRKEEKRD